MGSVSGQELPSKHHPAWFPQQSANGFIPFAFGLLQKNKLCGKQQLMILTYFVQQDHLEDHFYDFRSVNTIARSKKPMLGYKGTIPQLHDFNVTTTSFCLLGVMPLDNLCSLN